MRIQSGYLRDDWRFTNISGILVPMLLLTMAQPLAAEQHSDNGLLSATEEDSANLISSVEFVNTPITTLFRMISDENGWSILMSPEVSKSPPRINLWIKNMNAGQLLKHVAVLGSLVLDDDGKTIRVMRYDEYAKIHGIEKRVIQLHHATAGKIAPLLQQFVAKDQHKILVDDRANQIILFAPEPIITSLAHFVASMDVPLEKETILVVSLKHLKAAMITPVIERFIGGVRGGGTGPATVPQPATSVLKAAAADWSARGVGEGWSVQFMTEPKLNVIVLRGAAGDVNRVAKLIGELDIPGNVKVISYHLRHTEALDVLPVLQTIITEQVRRDRAGSRSETTNLKIVASAKNNLIIVEGSSADHERIKRIIDAIDVPYPADLARIRIFRLENATSTDVAAVLQNIVDDQQDGAGSPSPPTQQLPVYSDSSSSPPQEAATTSNDGATYPDISRIAPRVTDAPELNAVIVSGSAAELEELALVIAELDKPRDQVLLEMTLVRVRSTTGFNLGVEVGGATISDSRVNVLGFNTFGIAAVDSGAGAVRISANPPLGLNLAVFNASDFSLVLTALQSAGDTRITSAPRIVVEDNSLAVISELNQEPYVTTSQGEETTLSSFGGFVEAGTTLSVTPHISQKDWLRLEYEVILSSFGARNAAQIAANLPPPRLQSSSRGTVRIPDNHIIALGGLTSTRQEESITGVPILWDIPLIGELFKTRSINTINETLFIFIRPVVLRDPSFRDLMYLSESEIKEAELEVHWYPSNELKMFGKMPTTNPTEPQ